MKILVTGANGFVGQYLVKHLVDNDHSVIATGKGPQRFSFPAHSIPYTPMDFTDPAAVNEILVKVTPDLIVHTGAMSRPNDCETQQELAWQVNVSGTQHLLVAAAKLDASFVFISTDFVFDGERGMYSEIDEPRPVNYYGKTKREAEKLVQAYRHDWAIVRTVLVYGRPAIGASNILTLVKSKLEKGETYSVVNDQFRTPTYVVDLAKGIRLVIEKKATGIFHISGEGMTTPYLMACQVADHFGYDKQLLKEVNAAVFPEPARRPPRTGFNIEKAKRELGYDPVPFEEGLKRTFADQK